MAEEIELICIDIQTLKAVRGELAEEKLEKLGLPTDKQELEKLGVASLEDIIKYIVDAFKKGARGCDFDIRAKLQIAIKIGELFQIGPSIEVEATISGKGSTY